MSPYIARRAWESFTGSVMPRHVPLAARGREGYTLWRRTWASFIGFDLPDRRNTLPTAARSRGAAPVAQATASGRLPSDQPLAGRLSPGMFVLPQLRSGSVLAAAGADAVALETSSPDGRARFLVRPGGLAESPYSLELVLSGVDASRPLMSTISYIQSDGFERVLLVPVLQGPFGPPASFVRLPGWGVDTPWQAAVAVTVTPGTAWDAAAVADSVRAALNEATRGAWRRIRELVDDDLRDAIDRALR
ncbi:hypothetical protein ABUW04_06900 [Streptacidiphilus sp. N1-10]|uniref:Uncharacterized protein n=1 Tax=Streptacidiphilus jeojiensis TaxID=3229225 RepID=A0ABV6XIT0_9ACTN